MRNPKVDWQIKAMSDFLVHPPIGTADLQPHRQVCAALSLKTAEESEGARPAGERYPRQFAWAEVLHEHPAT